VIPDDVIDLIEKHITTVWALELLLLMRQHRDRAWTINDLSKDLRASADVVVRMMPSLIAGGLIAEVEGGALRYAPSDEKLDQTVARLDEFYKQFPVTIVRQITLAPNREAKGFADAFKFRKDKP
jgi:hypothetical protein